MKWVYLDWGVISSLKKEENIGLKALLLSNKDKLFFVYSLCHLEDLMRSSGNPLFDTDIKMMSDLMDDHMLYYKEGKFWMDRVSPEECCDSFSDNASSLSQGLDTFLSALEDYFPENDVSEQLKANLKTTISIPADFRANELFKRSLPGLPESPSVKEAIEACRLFLNDLMMKPGYYKEYRRQITNSGFRLESNAGNWNDEEALDKITLFLRSKGIDMSFDDYVASCFHNWPFTWVEFFTAAYCILDMLGFHADKLSKKSHTLRNMTTDAKHAVYAGICDWFVTADDGLYHKAKALYSHFRVPTCVMTPSEVVSAIKLEYQS